VSRIAPLQFPFVRDGFKHDLIDRVGLVCLCKRSKPEHWHYEVVKLRVRPAEERFGKYYPNRESYPSSEEWGTHGFSYLKDELNRAKERCEELQKGGCELVRG
jgi:hypothetical protein